MLCKCVPPLQVCTETTVESDVVVSLGCARYAQQVIMRRIKALSGLTTWQACCREPIRDSSCQDLCEDNLARAAFSRVNFSAGRRRVPALVNSQERQTGGRAY